MKKHFIVFIAILSLVSFGTAYSAHAFVEPISTTVLICGAAVVGITTLVDKIKNPQPEPAQVQDQQGNQTMEKMDNASETQGNPGLSTN